MFEDAKQWVDDDQAAEVFVLPPTIQWYRGRFGGYENKVIKEGGFELPLKNKTLESQKQVEVPHGTTGDTTVAAYLFPWLHVSLVEYRKDYYESYQEDGRWKKRFFPTWSSGRYSRIRAWVFVKELENEEYMLSFSSNDAGRFEQAYKQFFNKVIAPANVLAGVRFPSYAFWMPIKAGAKESVGQSYITPPTLALSEQIGQDKIKQLYLGSEQSLIEKAKAIYPQIKEWAEHKREEQQPQEPLGDAPPNFTDEQEVGLTEDQIPF